MLCHNNQDQEGLMANRNFASGGKIYAMHVMPVLLDCNFIVDSANGNGLGIRSLKGPMIQNVFMHTTATPGAGNSNPSTPAVPVINPNPAPGTIVIQMQDNYNRSFSGFDAIVSPVSGTALKIDNSALTAGIPYIITTLGDATTAQWNALGVPLGVTPAVGVSFIAASVGAGSNTSSSRVMTAALLGSSICTIETVGDPNLSINPDPTKNQGMGATFILQVRDYAGLVAAPTDGSVISLAFYLSNSTITVQGE
jgi:hypothetical protein